ncbi:uncharacterized protein LOC119590195 [Penaeus monodon]|uniref:uncharacterized protein LOC119590195 n=1 Tax=Penaeus monodon TaxID=6687 RepID=UPI0018A7949E|nr:uncharacterized protein LOC119590195 [Penaeus monodon]
MGILQELWTGERIAPQVKTSYQYVFDLCKRLEETMALARQNLEGAQSQYKKHYDRKSKARSFKAGDEVLVLLPATHNKLLKQWKAPLTVETCRDNIYQLKVGNKLKTFHANLLKGYVRRADRAADQQRTITSDNSDMDSPSTHNIENATAAVIEWEETNSESAISGDLLEALDRRDSSPQGQIEMGRQLTQLQRTELWNLTEQYPDMFSGSQG